MTTAYEIEMGTTGFRTPVVAPDHPTGPSRVSPPNERPRDAKGKFAPRITEGAPTLKQLWKFAQAYAESSVTNSKLKQLRVSDKLYGPEIKELARNLRLWNTAIDRNKPQILRKLQSKIILTHTGLMYATHYIKCDMERAQGVVGQNVTHYAPLVTRPINARDVFNDLIALCKFLPAYWVKDLKTIKFLTEPITLYDLNTKTLRYNFGQYFIVLSPTQPSFPTVRATTPRYAVGTTNVIHPFVRESVPCLGSGKSSAEKAKNEGRLFDLVEIHLAVLRTYTNLNRPYAPIEQWKGVCDERFDPATSKVVPMDAIILDANTQLRRCGMCATDVETLVSCYGCATSGCAGCIEPCANCGNVHRVCSGCGYICNSCNRRFCNHECFSYEGSDEYCRFCEEPESDYPEDDDDDDDHGDE